MAFEASASRSALTWGCVRVCVERGSCGETWRDAMGDVGVIGCAEKCRGVLMCSEVAWLGAFK